MIADLILIACEHIHAVFKVFGNHPLQIVAIKADQLAQKANGKKVLLTRFVFFFDNDLRENGARDVIAGFGIIDVKGFARLDHRGEILQRDIRTGRRVVQATVGVFLDGDALLGRLCAHDFVPA